MAKSDTNRLKALYLLLVLVLVVILVMRYSKNHNFELPTASRIDKERRNIETLRRQITNLQTASLQREQQRQQVADQTKYFWISDPKIATKVQALIEKIGRQNNISINRLGAPKTVEINDHVDAVEVQVRANNTDIASVSRFLRDIDNHEPALYWSSFSIRGDRVKNPTSINIQGKIRAVMLAEEAELYVQGKQP